MKVTAALSVVLVALSPWVVAICKTGAVGDVVPKLMARDMALPLFNKVVACSKPPLTVLWGLANWSTPKA